MKIEQKKDKIEISKDNDTTIDNTLELIKYATEVQSRIKTDINSDFVLAKFDEEKDKLAMVEMTNNAYLSKRMITDMLNKKVWKWNKTNKKWEQTNIAQIEQDQIQIIADQIFDIHMIRHQMRAILERNKKDNPILSGLMKTQAENPTITEEQEETLGNKIMNKFRNKKKEEAED